MSTDPIDRPGPDHRAEPVTVEVETTIVQTVPSTALNQLKHYAKSLTAGIISGLTYFLSVLTPAATLGDITLVQWIGFIVSVLGPTIGVAAVPNGAKPSK